MAAPIIEGYMLRPHVAPAYCLSKAEGGVQLREAVVLWPCVSGQERSDCFDSVVEDAERLRDIFRNIHDKKLFIETLERLSLKIKFIEDNCEHI
jgi:hypothetical protein